MDYNCFSASGRTKTQICFFLFLSTMFVSGQSTLQLTQIKKAYNKTKIALLKENFEREFAVNHKRISTNIRAEVWKSAEKQLDGTIVALNEIGTDGTPLYYTTLADKLSKTSRADALYTNGTLNLGINGEGMKVGVWDGGVALRTHQEFIGRVVTNDNTTEIDSHATLVTGAIVASGIKNKAQGVAYRATAISNNWSRDKIEVTEAAANGLLLSNHSYGIKTDRVPDWYFGSYIKVSQDWDKIMYNAPYYLMVTAAGNAQNLNDNAVPNYGKTADGFDLMLGFTTAKNGITVAAANTEINRNGDLKKASVTSYSSFGPIDDGRIKPDISGGGTVFSTHSSGNKNYDTATGTSLAAPGITGAMLLLQQHYEGITGNYMKAATLKGLVLHSADDIDAPGPDYKMGWGVINAKNAAEIISNTAYSTEIIESSLAEGERYTYTVNASQAKSLIASISWTDPASEFLNRGALNDPTPALVNDLDIRITQNGKTYYPWKLNPAVADRAATQGDNGVDPFEKIEIPNPSGTYTITITHKRNLTTENQDFSLIISGIAINACNPTLPAQLELIEPLENSIQLHWTPMEDTLFEVQYKASNTEEWVVDYTEHAFYEFADLDKEVSYSYRIRSFCTAQVGSDFTEESTFVFNGEETNRFRSLAT